MPKASVPWFTYVGIRPGPLGTRRNCFVDWDGSAVTGLHGDRCTNGQDRPRRSATLVHRSFGALSPSYDPPSASPRLRLAINATLSLALNFANAAHFRSGGGCRCFHLRRRRILRGEIREKWPDGCCRMITPVPDFQSPVRLVPLLSRGLKRPPPAFNSVGAMLSRKTFALALSSVACATANVFPSVRPRYVCLYVQWCISLQICFQLHPTAAEARLWPHLGPQNAVEGVKDGLEMGAASCRIYSILE